MAQPPLGSRQRGERLGRGGQPYHRADVGDRRDGDFDGASAAGEPLAALRAVGGCTEPMCVATEFSAVSASDSVLAVYGPGALPSSAAFTTKRAVCTAERAASAVLATFS
ncbi:hypothetical protein [Streptomyces coeruleorubidus]|uniref:hypothetical protein n=1 Tax=Streptomyces coeruleorubidus TaxID=116188 RepID=UPI0033E3AADD